MKLKTLHQGEHILAREILKIVPLIEKHFKPFNGQRASIQSGDSAAFRKVQKAFCDECATLTDMRIFVVSNAYSVYIKMDVHVNEPNTEHCNYFEHGSYIAEGRDADFHYTFKPGSLIQMCNSILSVSVKDLESVKAEIEGLKGQIDRLENSVPYQFKSVIE